MSEETILEAPETDVTDQAEVEAISEVGDGSAEGPSSQEEQPQSTSDSSTGNWWSTDGLDDATASRIKAAQADYTRTKQEAASLRREAERVTEYETRLKNYEQAIRQTLENPEEYERQRQIYYAQTGTQPQTSTRPQMPTKIETMEDLQNYIEQNNEWVRNSMQREFDSRLQAEINRIAQPIYKDRWSAANQALADDPVKGHVYQKYQAQVLSGSQSPMYQAMLQEGKTEQQILEAAFLQIPGVVDELLGTAKQTALKTVEAKKKAVTEKPKKGRPTKAASMGDIRADIINSLRSEGQSFE
jgi:hypothetical protein